SVWSVAASGSLAGLWAEEAGKRAACGHEPDTINRKMQKTPSPNAPEFGRHSARILAHSATAPHREGFDRGNGSRTTAGGPVDSSGAYAGHLGNASASALAMAFAFALSSSPFRSAKLATTCCSGRRPTL